MNMPSKFDADLEKRLSDRLMDVFIRAGLILAHGHTVLRDFLPLPCPDGVGPDSGDNPLSGPSKTGK